MNTGLTCTDITFWHTANNLLFKHFWLTIPAGQLVCIVWKSGCWKSTLLKLVSWEFVPHYWSIQRNEKEKKTLTNTTTLLSVSQHARLFPRFSVAKNLDLAVRSLRKNAYTFGTTSTSSSVDKALEFFWMQSVKYSSPSHLSWGMYQRIVLLRALFQAPSPELLLLDEPLSAVDRITKQELRQKIGAKIRQLQTTALRVTHDLREALYLADRILVLWWSPATVTYDLSLSQEFITDDQRRQYFTALLAHVEKSNHPE